MKSKKKFKPINFLENLQKILINYLEIGLNFTNN